MSKEKPTKREIKAIMLLVENGWLKLEVNTTPLFGKTAPTNSTEDGDKA